MAPRKTPISKKAAAQKVVEEEMEDEEHEEEVQVDSDVEQEEPEVEEEEADDDVEAEEEEKPQPKKGKKADADAAPKKREVSSAVPKELLDKVFQILKAGGEVSTTKKDIKIICDCFIKTMVAQVMEGDKVTMTNHMTFKRAARKERTHITPRTGVEVVKPAHYVMAMEVKPMLKNQFQQLKVDTADLEPKKKAAAVKAVKAKEPKVVASPKAAAPKKAKK